MTNFATFQNRVILLILGDFSSCFSHKTSLMCVYGHFLYYSWSSKFIPKVGHFWPFCLTTAFTKWSFLPHFKMMSFFENINCIFSRFPPKTSLTCVRSHFLNDFNSLCKMGNFATLQIASFFNIKCTCKPWRSVRFWRCTHTQTRGIWGNFLATFFLGHFNKWKKCKVQSQFTTLQMPFAYNRKSSNFSSTRVRICVKDATPLLYVCIHNLRAYQRPTLRPTQLVELCTGIAKVMVRVPVQAWNFQAFLAST